MKQFLLKHKFRIIWIVFLLLFLLVFTPAQESYYLSEDIERFVTNTFRVRMTILLAILIPIAIIAVNRELNKPNFQTC